MLCIPLVSAERYRPFSHAQSHGASVQSMIQCLRLESALGAKSDILSASMKKVVRRQEGGGGGGPREGAYFSDSALLPKALLAGDQHFQQRWDRPRIIVSSVGAESSCDPIGSRLHDTINKFVRICSARSGGMILQSWTSVLPLHNCV